MCVHLIRYFHHQILIIVPALWERQNTNRLQPLYEYVRVKYTQLLVEKSIWITPKSLFINAPNSKTTSKRAFNSMNIISALTSINSATFVDEKRSRRRWGLNTCTCPADGDQQKAQCTDLKCPKVLASWRVKWVKIIELDKGMHPKKHRKHEAWFTWWHDVRWHPKTVVPQKPSSRKSFSLVSLVVPKLPTVSTWTNFMKFHQSSSNPYLSRVFVRELSSGIPVISPPFTGRCNWQWRRKRPKQGVAALAMRSWQRTASRVSAVHLGCHAWGKFVNVSERTSIYPIFCLFLFWVWYERECHPNFGIPWKFGNLVS